VNQMRPIEFDQGVRKHFFLQLAECLTDERVDSARHGSLVFLGIGDAPHLIPPPTCESLRLVRNSPRFADMAVSIRTNMH
jgi:hypothetical protein